MPPEVREQWEEMQRKRAEQEAVDQSDKSE